MRLTATTWMFFAAVAFVAAPAAADWKEGDSFKIHFPQLPDPYGWDVNASFPMVTLADDFRCTETGPITDIHFWGSWKDDILGQLAKVHLSIHADDRTGPFSKPGELLWSWDGEPTAIRPVDPPSMQGWLDPATGQVMPQNHQRYFQYNITKIPRPFVQKEGELYWLDISATPVNGTWGWKTSRSPHYEDSAVWAPLDPAFPGFNWQELRGPTGLPLDLAFVITSVPEPSSLILVGLGAAGLFGLAILGRRRK